MPVDSFVIGHRPGDRGPVRNLVRFFGDYARFVRTLRDGEERIVLLNPSLGWRTFLREGCFLLLARACGMKSIVFFRGWDEGFASALQRRGQWLFRALYGKSDAFIVLAARFQSQLEAWGCTRPIYREVTVVDDDELAGFDIQQAVRDRLGAPRRRILYFSRAVREKGIYETIGAFKLLQRKYPHIELVIAGEGEELPQVESEIRRDSIEHVSFAGYVRGQEKREVLQCAHLLCFPTTHGEGLPNAVVEAMAFGLPVVTRRVGGLADHIEDGVHGFATDSMDPAVFAERMERLLADEGLYRQISLHNHAYARRHFLASAAVSRLEGICASLIQARHTTASE